MQKFFEYLRQIWKYLFNTNKDMAPARLQEVLDAARELYLWLCTTGPEVTAVSRKLSDNLHIVVSRVPPEQINEAEQ